MLWLNHPSFVPVREEVLNLLSARSVHFRKVKPVIFLCGGFKSPRRDRLSQYVKAHHSDALVFYADDVWSLLARRPELNALKMEEQLAALSDLVVIVVESPGTFAELGAFALQESLRAKLLPILDLEHKSAESFIKTGPVAWVNEDSKYGPAIWADRSTILDVVDELDKRLERLPSPLSHRINNLAEDPKHLVFFFADLAGVFGPCPSEHLAFYARRVLGRNPTIPAEVLIGLGCAMDLICRFELEPDLAVYYRPLEAGRLRTFQEARYLDLSRLRARVLSAMMGIPSATSVLDQLAA